MNSKDLKSTFIVLGIMIALLLVITIPIIIFSKKEEEEANFPDHETIEIKENDVADVSSKSYAEVKSLLENDTYFAKAAMITNFNSSSYTSGDIQKLLWNFIFNYSLKNRKYMASYDEDTGKFCMRSKYVIDAFKELYDVNITDGIQYLDSDENYVTVKNKKYCFNFANVAKDYNNDLLVGIDAISVKDDVVTTTLYLYEYYTTYTNNESVYIHNLKNYIASSRYDEAKKIVTDNLNGKVTHKRLQFHILNKGDHFKYQILVSQNLDY